MIVMPSNNTGFACGYLAGKYGNVGHLFSPGGYRRTWKGVPYALDNGRYAASVLGRDWNEAAFWGLLETVRMRGESPRWVVVPDIVGNAEATLVEWDRWEHALRRFGWPLAVAAQDGMNPDDVPPGADVIFIGGSTEWKRSTLWQWCEAFPRVHVGRINTGRWLWECWRAGAESCDGTGWFRGDPQQLADLERFLKRQSEGQGEPQLHMFDDDPVQCMRCDHVITASYAECPICHFPKPKQVAKEATP